jgi:dynein heavy chain
MNTYLSKAHARDGDNGPIPWSTLKYLIGEAMYGGRVVDSFDRRGVVVYLEEYMGDFLFDKFNRFAFYQTKEDSYVVPENGHVDIYKTQVENQPRVNTPEVFGLHSNAEIGYFTTASKDTLQQILSLQSGAGGGGGGQSKDQVVAQIAEEILEKLPREFDTFQIRNEIGISATPAQVVLMQELDRFNFLLKVMVSSLKTLQKALVGEVGMSAELEDLLTALFAANIPPSWAKKAPATKMRLANWMSHFQRRFRQYEGWVIKGEPKCMWLSGLHIPETYLAALVQQCCRTKGWALDRSTLYTKTTVMKDEKEVKAKPEFGAYIQGLFLEGAAWDSENMCLRKQDPKVLVVQLPITQIVPAEAAKVKLTNTLKTPVYTTSDRRNAMGVGLVFEADMTTYDDISHWILQGVALVLNTD